LPESPDNWTIRPANRQLARGLLHALRALSPEDWILDPDANTLEQLVLGDRD
jgi:hypothetical protein